MIAWTPSARRMGLWSAAAVFLISVIHVSTGVVWLVCGGESARFGPVVAGGLFELGGWDARARLRARPAISRLLTANA